MEIMFQWNTNNIINATGGRKVGNCDWICSSNISIDTRSIKKGDLFIALKGNNFDGHDFLHEAFSKGAVAAIVSDNRLLSKLAYERQVQEAHGAENRSVLNIHEDLSTGATTQLPTEVEFRKKSNQNDDFPLIIVENTLKALHDIASYYIQNVLVDAKIIAVTGSVGKTTTKDMLHTVLSQYGISHVNDGNLNNNIGLPLTVLKAPENCQYLILEMGMSKAGEIKELSNIANPDIAVITNIEPAHTENFSSLFDVAQAKLEVLHGMKNNGTLILNKDSDYYDYLSSQADKKVVSFGRHQDATICLLNLVRNNRPSLSFQYLSFPSSQHISLSFQHIPLSSQHIPLSFQHIPLSSQHISLSSQCVTLGSRYENTYKSYNGQRILGAYVKNNDHDEIGWIPASRAGMTPTSHLSYRLSCSSALHTGTTSDRAAKGLSLKIRVNNNQIINCKLHVQGEHFAYSALAVAAVMQSLGLDSSKLPLALEKFNVTNGRGNTYSTEYKWKHVCLIDDSYNANPASMKAAIRILGTYVGKRKVALLGDMLELGDESIKFHTELLDFIVEHNIDKVYTVGKFMLELHRLLPSNIKGVHFDDSNQLKDGLTKIIQSNDIILIKGSRGMKMDLIVQEILSS